MNKKLKYILIYTWDFHHNKNLLLTNQCVTAELMKLNVDL